MGHQKQVWIDIAIHRFLVGLPGSIAGHVRLALKIYVAIVKHEGYYDGMEIEVLRRLGIVED